MRYTVDSAALELWAFHGLLAAETTRVSGVYCYSPEVVVLEAFAYAPPGRARVAAFSVSISRGHKPVTRRRVEPVWRVCVGGEGMGVKGTVRRTVFPSLAPVGRLNQGARLNRHEKAT